MPLPPGASAAREPGSGSERGDGRGAPRAPQQGDDADPEVDEDGGHRRAAQSEGTDQDEAGGQAAADSPRQIDAVEPAEVAAESRIATRQEPHEDRKRTAHQDRRQQQQRSAEADAQHGQGRGLAFEGPGQGDVPGARPAHEVRQDQAVESDADLEVGVELQRGPAVIGAAPEPPGADAEAGHEHRQDRADRGGRGADAREELTDPDHLVDEGTRAGQEEAREDQRARCAWQGSVAGGGAGHGRAHLSSRLMVVQTWRRRSQQAVLRGEGRAGREAGPPPSDSCRLSRARRRSRRPGRASRRRGAAASTPGRRP